MKEIIALLVFILVAAITIYLSVTKQITIRLTITFLVFAIFSGLAVANYDFLKKMKWKDFEIETFERKVQSVKEIALEEIHKEIDSQKESIKLLISNANNIQEKIEVQKQIIKKTQEEIDDQKSNLESLNTRAESTERRIQTLHKASSDLALLLTKITWLHLETKSEFGTDRAKTAINQINVELNKIIQAIFPEQGERNAWILELKNSLRPRK